MAASDNHPLASLLLDVVKELGQDGINGFLAADNGEAVPIAPFTVGKRGWLGRVGSVDQGRIEGSPLTTEKIFGDPGKVGLRFPRIGGARGVGRWRNRVEKVVVIAVNRLPLTVEPAYLFPLRLLHPRTADKKKE